MEEKMITEYRTWFNILLKQLNDIEFSAPIKAEFTEESQHELVGMLTLMKGMKVITDEEYETMRKEVKEEFNTEKLYGFRYLMRTEVFHADRD